MAAQLRKTVPPLHFVLPVNTITLIVLGDRLGPRTGAAAMQVFVVYKDIIMLMFELTTVSDTN